MVGEDRQPMNKMLSDRDTCYEEKTGDRTESQGVRGLL